MADGPHPPDAARVTGYAGRLVRHAGLMTLALLLLAGLAGWLTSRLELRTDLAELLPEGSPSVRELRRIQERTHGVARLTVALEHDGPGGPAAVTRMAGALDALARALRADAGGAYEVDDGPRSAFAFLDRHALLYLDRADLEALFAEVEQARRELARAMAKRNPLFIDLEGSGPGGAEGPDATQAVAAARKRLEALAGRVRARLQARADALGLRVRIPDVGGGAVVPEATSPAGRYLADDGRLGAILLLPQVRLDAGEARRFVARIQRVVDRVDVGRIAPGVRVTLTGGLVQGLIEYDAFRRDIVSTAALCVLLCALVVWLYFRRQRVLVLLAVILAAGAALAFAVAWVGIGYLNGPVAFLSSVIVGTGINYGLVLLARLREERQRVPAGELALALHQAIAATWRPTLAAAATTAASFAALAAGHVLSFKHFGLVGAAGILVCWALSYTLLPALVVLIERLWPDPDVRRARVHAAAPEGTETRVRRAPRYPFFLARLPARRPVAILVVSAVLAAASAVVLVRELPTALESDLTRLRTRSALEGPAAQLEARVQKLVGTPALPAVIVARDAAQADRICQVLEERRNRAGQDAAHGACRTLSSFLPEEQAPKLELLARLRAALDALEGRAGAALGPEDRRTLAAWRARLVTSPVGTADLPAPLRRAFSEKNGRVGTLALLDPPAAGLWDVNRLRRFAAALSRIDLGEGEVVRSSGEAVVFADLLENITVDAPRTSLLALGLVLLLVLAALRTLQATLLVGGTLLLGVATMMAASLLLGHKINFFNFVALPTTFGIGVDYLVNVYARYDLERVRPRPADPALAGPGPVERVLWTTGGAVVLCSATTIIGYATLLIADNRALASFGALAAIGELTCLAAALIVLPAGLALLERRSP